MADRIAHVRQAAKIADLLFTGEVKEITFYNPSTGTLRVLMKGGNAEEFQL